MDGERDNPVVLEEPGTDNTTTSDTDTAPEWDYYDPDEEQDTEEAPEAAATDDEEPEAPDNPDEEPEEGEESPEQPTITLTDGRKLTAAEVEKGVMFQADYTRKTQELANARKLTDESAKRIDGITDAIIDHLTKLMPVAPDSSLAWKNPAQYTQMKAMHESALADLQRIIELGQQVKGETKALSDDEKRQTAMNENALLTAKFPELADQKKRAKFFDGVQDVATRLGFTNEELSSNLDHRLFALAHWAKRGMDAEAARKVAKEKAKAAPPVSAPNKPGQKANGARNTEAMRKLAKSGSIRDALMVDFD